MHATRQIKFNLLVIISLFHLLTLTLIEALGRYETKLVKTWFKELDPL
jgi:hypothetical protein